MRNPLLWTAFLAVILSACHSKSERQVAPSPKGEASAPATVSVAPVLVSQTLRDSAFRTAFGSAAPLVLPTPEAPDSTGEAQTMVYTPDKLYDLGTEYILVTNLRNKMGCHACDGALALTHFSKSGGALGNIAGKTQIINEGKEFGAPPDWALDTSLLNTPVLVLGVGYGGQGCFVDYHTLYGLNDARKLSTDYILIDYDYESGEEGAKPLSVKSKIANVQRGREFDMVYSGSANRTVHYTFDGRVYTPDSDVSTLPGC